MKHLSEAVAHAHRGEFIRYASGNFAKSLHESTFSFLYLFYLIDVVGVHPATVGTALLLSLLLDAALNPWLGHFIDRTLRGRWSYQRMMLSAAPYSAAFFILLFVLPAALLLDAGMEVFLASVLFKVGSTLVDVPHNALLARLSPDGYDRVRLSTWRFFFSSLGNMAIVFVLAPTLTGSGPAAPEDFGAPIALITAIYLAVIVYCGTGVTVAPPLHTEKSRVPQRSHALWEIARNTRLLRILLACVLAAALETVFSRTTVFYAKAGLGDAYSATYLVAAQMCGQLVGLPLWQALARKLEKTSTAIAAQLLMAISMGLFFAVSPQSLMFALPLFFLVGVSMGGLTVMNWAIVPDTIEYTEAATGRRHEALTFGVLSCVNKVASGVATALVGWMLAAVDYAHADSRDVVAPLIAAMTAIPLLGALASLVVLAGMRLTYQSHRALAEKT